MQTSKTRSETVWQNIMDFFTNWYVLSVCGVFAVVTWAIGTSVIDKLGERRANTVRYAGDFQAQRAQRRKVKRPYKISSGFVSLASVFSVVASCGTCVFTSNAETQATATQTALDIIQRQNAYRATDWTAEVAKNPRAIERVHESDRTEALCNMAVSHDVRTFDNCSSRINDCELLARGLAYSVSSNSINAANRYLVRCLPKRVAEELRNNP